MSDAAITALCTGIVSIIGAVTSLIIAIRTAGKTAAHEERLNEIESKTGGPPSAP